MDDATRALAVERIAAAHAELDAHLVTMPADATAPSLLPGWSRGHVLSHLARNAEGFVRILRGVEDGVVAEQYVGGAPARNAAIEAGATRAWGDVVADVEAAGAALVVQLAGQRRWDGAGLNSWGSSVAAADLPFMRWREVLVHHADLGDGGYTPADWPAEYVAEELRRQEMAWNPRAPMGTAGLPELALRTPPLQRLLWLLGRAGIDGLEPAGIF